MVIILGPASRVMVKSGELWDLLRGIEIASNYGFRNVIIESDLTSIIATLNDSCNNQLSFSSEEYALTSHGKDFGLERKGFETLVALYSCVFFFPLFCLGIASPFIKK